MKFVWKKLALECWRTMCSDTACVLSQTMVVFTSQWFTLLLCLFFALYWWKLPKFTHKLCRLISVISILFILQCFFVFTFWCFVPFFNYVWHRPFILNIYLILMQFFYHSFPLCLILFNFLFSIFFFSLLVVVAVVVIFMFNFIIIRVFENYE